MLCRCARAMRQSPAAISIIQRLSAFRSATPSAAPTLAISSRHIFQRSSAPARPICGALLCRPNRAAHFATSPRLTAHNSHCDCVMTKSGEMRANGLGVQLINRQCRLQPKRAHRGQSWRRLPAGSFSVGLKPVNGQDRSANRIHATARPIFQPVPKRRDNFRRAG